MKINAINQIKHNFGFKKSPIIINAKPETNKTSFKLSDKQTYLPCEIGKIKLVSKRRKLLKTLSDKEYSDIINNKVPNYTSLNGYHCPVELLGLLPYCGIQDISDKINRWLTGRKLENKSDIYDEQMATIVNALNYSLKKLDKNFGKYKGTVYRYGFFNPLTNKQYWSCSKSATCAASLSQGYFYPSINHKYSIIKIKNGHKIADFQECFGKDKEGKAFAEAEQEILIDRNSKFRLVPEEEYTQEDIDNKIKIFEVVSKRHHYGKDKDVIEKSIFQSGLKNIDIWEEV